MEEDLMSSEDFFGDFDEHERVPFRRLSDIKSTQKGKDAFEDVKVRMVMKLETCSREKAVRIIAARAEELRRLRNAPAT